MTTSAYTVTGSEFPPRARTLPAGTGRPLIFVTDWTGTGEFFAPYQISHFSKKYRVVPSRPNPSLPGPR
jgi:hypothetical protein